MAALCAMAAAEAAAAAEARLASELGREAELAQARLAEDVAALATAVADRQGRLRADAVGVGAALGRLLAYEAIARNPLAAAASVLDELIAELRDEADVVVEVAPALVDGLRARLDAVAADPRPGSLVEVRAGPGLRGGEVRVLWRDGWAERLLRDLEARAAEILAGFEEAGGPPGRVVVVEDGEIAEVSA